MDSLRTLAAVHPLYAERQAEIDAQGLRATVTAWNGVAMAASGLAALAVAIAPTAGWPAYNYILLLASVLLVLGARLAGNAYLLTLDKEVPFHVGVAASMVGTISVGRVHASLEAPGILVSLAGYGFMASLVFTVVANGMVAARQRAAVAARKRKP